jgi:H/ACA ribonucleoprotein complex subunit 1
MLCSLVTPTRIPYFNAPIYLENKTQIGKVDEILGPINEVFFTVKMEQGMVASSFKKEHKVYIGGDKLLPIERFLPKPKGTTESKSLYNSTKWNANECREGRWPRWRTWRCTRR